MDKAPFDKLSVTERTVENSIAVISLAGRFDAHAVDDTEAQMNQKADQSGAKFILDMDGVTFLGSGGIRILLALSQKMREKKGRFAIINMPSSGLKIIKAMEIDRLFNIMDCEQAAIDFVLKE